MKNHNLRVLALLCCGIMVALCAVACLIAAIENSSIGQALLTFLLVCVACLIIAEADTVEQEHTKRHALDKGGHTRGDM